MPNEAKLKSDIQTLFDTTWSVRNGTVVPKTDDVVLKNGAVKMEAVLLYADLFHSTELQRKFQDTVVAKVVRAYLSSMTRLIRDEGGHVRSFDGDRVMGVFIGGSKHSEAARCALKMKYTVSHILRPKAEAKWSAFGTKGFKIEHCAGIAKSDVFIVRGGIRDNNDLVFVGSAPNIAAKLSAMRERPYHTWITWQVYNQLQDYAKLGSDGNDMWISTSRTLAGETWSLYKSSYHWKP